ncbi:hypothetical protein C8R47DRAFT_143834 [Mycena vitilis]|nr:hypothetical protein C8R47DRAFT_143834 [Mycena vitilis]
MIHGMRSLFRNPCLLTSILLQTDVAARCPSPSSTATPAEPRSEPFGHRSRGGGKDNPCYQSTEKREVHQQADGFLALAGGENFRPVYVQKLRRYIHVQRFGHNGS